MRTDDTRCCCRIKLRVREQTEHLKLNMEQVRFIYADLPEYEGEYTVTPQPYEQVLPTRGKRMDHDLTVEAIPQNYGLISWNGAILTVS